MATALRPVAPVARLRRGTNTAAPRKCLTQSARASRAISLRLAAYGDRRRQEELAELETEENIVGEEYLTGYFEEKPELYLVDPQSLLGTKEKQDLQSFLDYHASDSSIDMYIYVFGGDQQIPGDVREEEVVERLYSKGKMTDNGSR